MQWREFKSLGTEIIISATLEPGQENILNKVEEAIKDFNDRFSRFVKGNELDAFNNASSGVIRVSPTLAQIISEAKDYFNKTGGIFDPSIISDLESAGYGESFDKILKPSTPDEAVFGDLVAANLDDKSGRATPNISRPSLFTQLEIRGEKIIKPPGLRLDLGGIGKGYIVDRLTKELLSSCSRFWLSAGGDIIISGRDEGKNDWEIGVQNPYQPLENIFTLSNRGEKLGIATSGIIKRAGIKDGRKWHHLIDPRSGQPVLNDVLSVTLISSSATQADIFAKTVLILGRETGLKFIEQETDSAAIIFPRDKKPIFSRRAKLYLKNYEKNL